MSRQVRNTIIEFQKKAEQIIYVQIPKQVQKIIEISKMPYFQQDFKDKMQEQFDNLQKLDVPFVKQEVTKDPLIIYPPSEFLDVEQSLRHELQNVQILISEVRQSIETQSYRKRTTVQEEAQQLITQQLEQTQSSLTEVLSLFLQYHESRGDIVYKLQKHQGIDFYLLLKLQEIKIQKALAQFVQDFRIHLVLLYEMILANYNKLYQKLDEEPKHLKSSQHISTNQHQTEQDDATMMIM